MVTRTISLRAVTKPVPLAVECQYSYTTLVQMIRLELRCTKNELLHSVVYLAGYDELARGRVNRDFGDQVREITVAEYPTKHVYEFFIIIAMDNRFHIHQKAFLCSGAPLRKYVDQ